MTRTTELEDIMNRIEIIGLFTALKQLCDKEDMEGVKEVVKAVLEEARSKDDKG